MEYQRPEGSEFTQKYGIPNRKTGIFFRVNSVSGKILIAGSTANKA